MSSGDCGERLKAARGEIGLNQADMAAAVGVSKAAWQSYEYGNSEPKLSTLQAMAGQGLSARWLVTGEGPMMAAETETASNPIQLSLDDDLLRDTIEALEEVLAEQGLSLAPDKKAKAIALTYELFAEGGEVDRERIGKIIRLAA